MRYLLLIPVGLWLIGCGTTVIGEGVAISHTGGSQSTGGAVVASGGAVVASGGAVVASGGANAASGGAVVASGGAVVASGGAVVASGGAVVASTGGAITAGGMISTTGGAFAASGGSVAETGGSRGFDYCGGTIVSDTAGCQLDDAYCVRLSDGRFCTGTRVLPCPNGTTSMPAVECPANHYWCWSHGLATACRLPLYTMIECAEAGGIVQADPGDGSLVQSGCASPLVNLGVVDASVGEEGGICCGQGSETTTGPTYCGGRMVGTSAQCLLDDSYCYQLSNGQYCTGSAAAQCPPGTEAISRLDCPENSYWCWPMGIASACRLPTRTGEECALAGGEVRDDPGNGSVMANGCPATLIDMGRVQPGGIEGSICCGRPQ